MQKQILRNLDDSESLWNALHKVGNLFIVNTIKINSQFPICLRHIQKASTFLLHRHQILRCRVVQSPMSKQWVWKEMDAVQPYCRVLNLSNSQCVSESHIIQAMRIEQEIPLNVECGPLWRVAISFPHQMQNLALGYEYYLHGVFHHAIIDGISRQQFWNELLGLVSVIQAQNVAKNNQCQPHYNIFQDNSMKETASCTFDPIQKVYDRQLPQTQLPAALSKILRHNVVSHLTAWTTCVPNFIRCMTKIQRALFLKLRNPFSQRFPSFMYGSKKEMHGHKTLICPIILNQTQTKKLLQLCRSKKVTFNSLIISVASVSLASMLSHTLDQNEDFLKIDASLQSQICSDLSLFDKLIPTNFSFLLAVNCRRWGSIDGVELDNRCFKKFLDSALHSCSSQILQKMDNLQSDAKPNLASSMEDHASISTKALSSDSLSSLISQNDSCSSEIETETEVFNDSQTVNLTDYQNCILSSTSINNHVSTSNESLELQKNCLPLESNIPGLGSYAMLVPFQSAVDRSAKFETEIWRIARSSFKSTQFKLNRNTPFFSSVFWMTLSRFIKRVSFSYPQALELTSPSIRPYPFLVSNSGPWNPSATFPQIFGHQEENVDKDLEDSDTKVTNSSNYKIRITESWSAVTQHEVGLNVFSHNLVTVEGSLCWSLQYHTNLTNSHLAQCYAKRIHRLLDLLSDDL